MISSVNYGPSENDGSQLNYSVHKIDGNQMDPLSKKMVAWTPQSVEMEFSAVI